MAPATVPADTPPSPPSAYWRLNPRAARTTEIPAAIPALATLAELPGRTYYVHMNNTNPILDHDSNEMARLAAVGVGVAFDGMELTL